MYRLPVSDYIFLDNGQQILIFLVTKCGIIYEKTYMNNMTRTLPITDHKNVIRLWTFKN